MGCFSMGWIEQLCIWLIMVIAIVAIFVGLGLIWFGGH